MQELALYCWWGHSVLLFNISNFTKQQHLKGQSVTRMHQDKNKSTLFLCPDKTWTLSISRKHSLVLVRPVNDSLNFIPAPPLLSSSSHLTLPHLCLHHHISSLTLSLPPPCYKDPMTTLVLQGSVQFSSVLSRIRPFATPWTAGRQASLSITNSRSLPKPMSIESVMPSSHLILCHPLLLLPSIFPSIRIFSNESALHIRWPKYWSFRFNISPSKEHSGLISFRMDWLDLLAVQGTLKSLLQHRSSKASVLWCSA